MAKRWVSIAMAAVLAAFVAPAWAGSAGKGAVRFEDGKGISAPTLKEKVAPVYPADAREEGIGGKVVLDARIGVDGKVAEVTTVESPDGRLSRAAEDAISKWVYEPARDKTGRPVEVIFTVTVSFRLQ